MDISLSILGGLAVLVLGAELLVRGAVRLAEGLGVSALVIGLTVVGFGTSTPELMTSVQGAIHGSPGIAVGNIVGSNLFNILVILGISAMLAPLAVSASALRRDGKVMLLTAGLFTLVGLFWTLDRLAGLAFLALLVAFLVQAFRQEKRAAAAAVAARPRAGQARDPGVIRSSARQPWLVPVALVLAGLAALVIGAQYFVDGSIALARALGVSETVIGLTIVAAGTSMPELATSAVAAFRRQSDVAVGNILGSNIYNILGIGGVTALISPTPVPAEIARFDAPLMLAVSLLLLWFMSTDLRITRREGAVMFLGYLAYVWWIWPAATI